MMLAATGDAGDAAAPSWTSQWQLPSQGEAMDALSHLADTKLGLVVALLLLACGLVYLVQGWKIFKILVVANAAVLGAMLGARVGGLMHGENMWLWAGSLGALLCATLSWPLMKYAVSVMGGLSGSLLGYGLWFYVGHLTGQQHILQYAWAGALIGLVTLGLLAFVVFRLVITIFTALQGSVMTVAGLVSLLMVNDSLATRLEPQLRNNQYLLLLLLAVPAIIGVGYQYSSYSKKAAGKKPPSSGGGGG
jgi:MFS family permease